MSNIIKTIKYIPPFGNVTCITVIFYFTKNPIYCIYSLENEYLGYIKYLNDIDFTFYPKFQEPSPPSRERYPDKQLIWKDVTAENPDENDQDTTAANTDGNDQYATASNADENNQDTE